jgi:hypothetical protein
VVDTVPPLGDVPPSREQKSILLARQIQADSGLNESDLHMFMKPGILTPRCILLLLIADSRRRDGEDEKGRSWNGGVGVGIEWVGPNPFFLSY